MQGSELRIGLVAPALPPVVGGAESAADSMIRVLMASGLHVDVVTGTESASVRDLVIVGGGRFRHVDRSLTDNCIAWEFDCFARSETLWRLNAENPIALWHVFSHDSAIAVAMTSPSAPIVGTFSEMATEGGGYGDVRSRFTYSLPQLSLITASSDFYAGVAERHGYPADQIRRVMTGVDVVALRRGDAARGRELLNLDDDRPVVLCPSRFTPRKGQMDLVESADLLRQEAQVILLGSSNSGSSAYLHCLRSRISELCLDNVVSIRSGLDHGDMAHVYAAADLVVQPSYGEGLGLSALEALAAAVPLVGTSVSGFDSFLRHEENALVGEPGDVALLAANINRLLSDSELSQRLARRGTTDVEASFGRDHMEADIMAVYCELLPELRERM